MLTVKISENVFVEMNKNGNYYVMDVVYTLGFGTWRKLKYVGEYNVSIDGELTKENIVTYFNNTVLPIIFDNNIINWNNSSSDEYDKMNYPAPTENI